MQKLTFVLVVAALGLAAWQILEASYLRGDLEAARQETAELRADLDRVRDVLAGRASPLPEDRMPPARAEGDDPSPARLAPVGASPEVIARTVRDLQDRVADVEALEEKVDGLEEKIGKRVGGRLFQNPHFIRDLTSATRVLDLSPRQRDDVERIVEDTKRQIEDLHRIPNEEGKTFEEVSKVKVTSGEGFQLAFPNFGEMQEFRESLVPGSSETYGEAEKRLRERGKQDVRNLLTPEQQKRWDRARSDALFGASFGTRIVSFATTSAGSASD